MNDKIVNYLNSQYKIIVITGPTASGKTDVSIQLSKLLPIEVISADSRQIYKYLNIGTATPGKSELKQLKTYLINILRPDEYFSAGLFVEKASKKIKKIINKGKLPVIVGGTGLYIKALFEGLFQDNLSIELKQKIRNKLNSEYQKKGINYLYEKLINLDKKAADMYLDKNPRRIIRALEYIELSGKKYSEQREKIVKANYQPIYFAIDFDRNELYDRINKRTILMLKKGLIRETKRVLSLGFSKDLNSLNTVGYKEVIAYLENKINEDEMVRLIQKNTRNYAKRQLTWLRKIPDIIWLKGNSNQIAEQIVNTIKDKFI